MNFSKFTKPVAGFLGGEGEQICEFFLQKLALDGEFEIVINYLPQEAGQKTKRQSLKGSEIVEGKLSGFRGVAAEHFRFEIARKHKSYSNSGIGLPGEKEGEKPIRTPRVGTKSMVWTV